MKPDDSQTVFEFPPTIWELKPQSCRYVVNDKNPAGYIFCGKPKETGSYCKEHYRLCYIPNSAPIFRQNKKGEWNVR